MDLNALDYFFENFAEEQMNLLYAGDFNDELTDNLIELNNHQFTTGDEFKKYQRKAGFLIAECFQNIVRHSDLSNENSYFHIKNDKGLFSIVSGNTVENELIPSLKGQLEQLNELTSDELKLIYRQTLAEGNYSQKGGAGLGLIEMARKTKNKLTFTFSEIDEEKSYFYFRLQLKTPEFTGNINNSNFDTSIALRNRMLSDGLFLIYKGPISTPVTVSLLGMLDNTLKRVNQKVVFARFTALIEKVSGLLKEDKEAHPSMIYVGKDQRGFNIGTNVLASHSEAFSIKRIVELYKSCDNDFLNQHYDQVLNDQAKNEVNRYTLDIIEILRNSSTLDCEIRTYSDNLSLLSLIMRFEKKSLNTEKKTKLKLENKDLFPPFQNVDSSIK